MNGGENSCQLEEMCKNINYNKLTTKPFSLIILHLSSKTILKNTLIREAILKGLDFNKICTECKTLYGKELSTKSNGILDNFFKYSERLYKYKLANRDVNGAINLLKENNLWPLSKTIKIAMIEGAKIKPILHIIKDNLEDIGIKSEIISIPKHRFLEEQKNAEISFFQLTFDTLDPYQTLYDVLDIASELEEGVKENILSSKKILLHNEKNKKLQEIEKEALESNYVIPICHSKAIILSKNNLNGIYTNDLDTIFLDEVFLK